MEINTQEPEFQKIMNEIYNDYGVRIVTNAETTIKDLNFLKEEFKIYKTASKGEAKFPALFDIRTDYYILKKKNVGAHTNKTSKIVNPARYIRTTTPRHELAHMQENVLKRKKVKRNESDRQELLNAGISEGRVDYFFKNEQESWARFAEGDMSRYSEDFKQKMLNKRKGLPAWITNLTHNSPATAYYKSMFPGKKNERIISEIQEVLGDETFYITSKEELKILHKICKKYPKDTKINLQELKERFSKELKHMRECHKEAKHRKRMQKFDESNRKLEEEINAQKRELEKFHAELDAELEAIRNKRTEVPKSNFDFSSKIPSILDRL